MKLLNQSVSIFDASSADLGELGEVCVGVHQLGGEAGHFGCFGASLTKLGAMSTNVI